MPPQSRWTPTTRRRWRRRSSRRNTPPPLKDCGRQVVIRPSCRNDCRRECVLEYWVQLLHNMVITLSSYLPLYPCPGQVLWLGRLPDGQAEGRRREAGVRQQSAHRRGHPHSRVRACSQVVHHSAVQQVPGQLVRDLRGYGGWLDGWPSQLHSFSIRLPYLVGRQLVPSHLLLFRNWITGRSKLLQLPTIIIINLEIKASGAEPDRSIDLKLL